MPFYTFRTPTVEEGLVQWEYDPLLRRLHLDQGISILEGPPGAYRAVRFPTQDEILASLPAFYQGGHEYVVDSATRQALINAGVGVTSDNFTLIVSEDGMAIESINGFTGPIVVLQFTDVGANRQINVNSSVITSGNLNPIPSTSGAWAPLPTTEIQMPAAVGDFVEATPSFMWQPGGTCFLDLCAFTGVSTIARYASTGTASPAAANEGDPALYPGTAFVRSGASFGFTVTSGDLDSGNVRFAVAARSDGVSAVLYASTNYPLRWTVKNYGPVL